ncbi:MAG: flavodoxin [Sporolactobacillus sp.]
MKKILEAILSVLMILTLAACGSNGNGNGNGNDTATSQPKTSNNTKVQAKGKILIAYFTMPERDGVDTVASASRLVVDRKVVGNTQFVAQNIQKAAGGDLFAIKTVQRYPAKHGPLVDQADNEQADNARPKLSTHIDNLDDYNVIFIGYPNWWGDLPMPLYSFLDEYNFSGKTIIPFSTHGGSGFAGTINTIAKMEPKARVIKDGFTVSRDDVADAKDDVNQWVKGLNLAK